MRKPDDAVQPEDGEPFLSRWSRKKEEAREAPPPAKPEADPKAPAPDLPPVESLTPDSDYRAFLNPKVDEGVRRAALKKLFSDPHFNVMDGLDIYIDDYSKTEPIPPEMLAGMKTVQDILRWAKEDKEEHDRQEALQAAANKKKLGPPARDDSAPGALAAEAAPPVPESPRKDS